MKQDILTIYCDGGSRGNPGEASYGFVIKDQTGEVIYKEGKRIGIETNNVAEYMAVVSALFYVEREKIEASRINFFLDSLLVVSQMNGKWKIKNERLRELLYSAKQTEKKLGILITFTAIPREQNKEADRMVNLALDNQI